MPYNSNEELPAGVKGLPDSAKSVWRGIFNAAYEQYKDDSQAAATAWAGLKRAGWMMQGGKWMHSAKSIWVPEAGLNLEDPAEGAIVKIDEEHNQVFGWAYVAIEKDGKQVVDHSKERVTPENFADLEQAIYDFNILFRDSGERHKGVAKGELIECIVFTKEKIRSLGLPEFALPQGVWVGFHFDDETFAKVKKGDYKMFSIEGFAEKEEVAD